MATVQEQIEQIEAAVLNGLPVSSATRMLAKLEEKREKLSALPSRPAGWDIQLTDETWREYWASLDDEGMRAWLLAEGLTVTVKGYPRGSERRFELGQIRPVAARPAVTR